ncbi:MAG: type II toxin-antitoxin system VapC family toxin [Candidatus Heimdallarchaeota archaeon]|nr:type II toxin-antitoxin system VapC family toxin [Candidatus Heimdallarchaeota archaeon]
MLLDSDFLIMVLRKDPKALSKLEEIRDKSKGIAISYVNLWELYKGAYKSSRPEEEIKKISILVSFFTLLEFTKKVDQEFGKLLNQLNNDGKPIGVLDTLIASIALNYNKTVVTKNVKHFERTGVKIESW